MWFGIVWTVIKHSKNIFFFVSFAYSYHPRIKILKIEWTPQTFHFWVNTRKKNFWADPRIKMFKIEWTPRTFHFWADPRKKNFWADPRKKNFGLRKNFENLSGPSHRIRALYRGPPLLEDYANNCWSRFRTFPSGVGAETWKTLMALQS